MKYIDADKLKAKIKELQCEQGFDTGEAERAYQFAIKDSLAFIDSLQQEQPAGVQGTVHHYGGIVHYVVTNLEQLNARLIQFPNDAEVEMFIEARKEE